MKNIITTVGTSIFTNYKDEKKNKDIDISIKNKIGSLDKKGFTEWNNNKPSIDKVRNEVLGWAKENSKNASAETKSLEKIAKKYRDELEIYLVTSDTILSNLAADIIEKIYAKNKWQFKIKKIDGLDIYSKDNQLIDKGFQNLIKYCLDTSYKDFIFNISGGYKAIIPIMTFISSIKHCEITYIYEDSEYLVTIPPFPLEYDIQQCKKFEGLFKIIDNNTTISKNELEKFKHQISDEDKLILSSFLKEEEGDDNITFSEIGFIIWEEYKNTKDITLVKCDIKLEDKKIKLSGDHHGNNKLKEIAKKIVKCEYVCEIINSLQFEPNSKNFIREIKDGGIVEITLFWEDAGYGLVIKTTGRNKRETEAIADIIKDNYSK